MNSPAQTRSVSSIAGALVLGLAAIYLIPFHVPVYDGLSDSYMFGYSNRTATLLIAAFTLGFALWTRGMEFRLPDGTVGDRFQQARNLAIACSILGCILFWMIGRAVMPLLESQYFLDRYAMYGMGGKPYADFTFDYGPLMFYLPVWVAGLCRLSLADGYYLTWLLQWALGTWVLWKVVEVAARGTQHGRAIFLLLWAFFLTGMPDSGTNYTPLRFCTTLALALAVHHLHAQGAPKVQVFGVACVGAAAMLFFSPEQGIAFTIGTILFFVLCVRPTRGDLLVGVAGFIVCVVFVFWAAYRLGMLRNVAAVGGGTLNFPLLFSFQTVTLLLLLLSAGCIVIASFRTGTSGGPLLYLICVSLVSAPAAFSRADVGHIVLNTLGALLAALVVLSQYPALWRWTWTSFVVLLVLSTYGKFTWYKGAVQFAIHDVVFGTQYHSPEVTWIYTTVYKASHRDAEARLEQLSVLLQDDEAAGTPLPAGSSLLAPLGAQRRITPPPDGIHIVTGRYPWLFPMSSLAPIDEKIAEIEAHPDWPLLLPSRKAQACVFNPDGERRSLRKFLLAPYIPPPLHTLEAGAPLCDYINSHFALSHYASPLPRSFVWVRKGDVAAATGPN